MTATAGSLTERIQRAYRLHTGAETPRGAQAWFARMSHSDPTTVYRWLKAGHLPGPALGLLEHLERTTP